MKRLALTAALLPMLTCAQAAPSSFNAATFFAATCASCHGSKAQGVVGPSLKGAAGWKYDLFKRTLLKGVNKQGKPLSQPHYGKGSFMGTPPSEAQLKQLQTYLKTLTK